MKKLLAATASAVVLVSLAPILAGEPATAGEPMMVLDQARGSFRAFMTWRTPTLVTADGKLKQPLEAPRRDLKEEDRKPVPVRAADGPAKGWLEPGFDDSWWPRAGPWVTIERVAPDAWQATPTHADAWRTPGVGPEWHTVCVRGKFVVTDPDRVQDLRFSAGFRGGAVLYVNGKEVCRAHLPAGALAADTLAEPYPRSAYVSQDGKLLSEHSQVADDVDRQKSRSRSFAVGGGGTSGVAIPRSLLRKGVNVVAVEVRAAPIRDDVDRRLFDYLGNQWQQFWGHAVVFNARLTAAAADGLEPNVGPRPGIAIANSSPIETVEGRHYAQPGEKLFPVRLVGAKNGTFSGKVVLSSTAEFRLTKAAAGDLAREGGPSTGSGQGAGRIPASAVLVRYAERPRPEVSYMLDSERYDRLLSSFPAVVAVRPTHNGWHNEYRPAGVIYRRQADEALAPVWVTVRVPADAPAGIYRGAFAIEAEGAAPVKFEVPVEIKVNDWALPNPRDFAARNNIYQSTDSVAQYYKVPLWSDKHFELMGKSVEGLCALGSRVCVLNLVYSAPGFSNSEGMVRWVKKAGGGYDYDFTVADKYMDLYVRIVGKPAMVMLNLWEHPQSVPGYLRAEPGVTVLDPATGKTERMPQPAVGTPESEAFWRPVLAELRKRLEKRGWFDVTAVCSINHAQGPTPETVEVYRNIWPDGKWLNCAHIQTTSFPGAKGKPPAPVAFDEFIWGWPDRYDPDGAKVRRYPRPRITPETGTVFFAHMHGPGDGLGSKWSPHWATLAHSRNVCEMVLKSGFIGLGRVGGDFWPLPTGPRGKYMPLCDVYRGVNFGSNGCLAMLSPGPDGAIFTENAEAFREGVQFVEAILYLQRAADSKGVPAQLAGRIEALLDERARYLLRTGGGWFIPFVSSAWQERDDRLFALCAEAAKNTAGR